MDQGFFLEVAVKAGAYIVLEVVVGAGSHLGAGTQAVHFQGEGKVVCVVVQLEGTSLRWLDRCIRSIKHVLIDRPLIIILPR